MTQTDILLSALSIISIAIAIGSIVYSKKHLSKTITDLEKLRGELCNTASKQEHAVSNTSQEFRNLLTQQNSLNTAAQKEQQLSLETSMSAKFDRIISENLLRVEMKLSHSIVNLEKECAATTKILETVLKDEQELKTRTDSINKILGDVNRQLVGLQLDVPVMRDNLKKLQELSTDMGGRVSSLPGKVARLEEWLTTSGSEHENNINRLLSDFRILKELSTRQNVEYEKSIDDIGKVLSDLSTRNDLAIRSALMDKFLVLIDSDKERKNAALKFVRETAEEKMFAQMCMEFPSTTAIDALRDLASQTDNKDACVKPLLRLADSKLDAGMTEEAKTLYLQLTEVENLDGDTTLQLFAKLAQISREQNDSEYAEVILNKLRQSQKGFTTEQKAIATEILNQLTELFEATPHSGKLESVYKRLHESYIASGQINELDAARNLRKLADLYFEENRTDEAEPAYKRSYNVLAKTLGVSSLELKGVLTNLATISKKMDNRDDQEKYELQLVSLLSDNKEQDGLDLVLESLSEMAEKFAAQGDEQRAETLLTRCAAAAQNVYGSENDLTREAYARLERVCNKTEDKDKLKKIYRRQIENLKHDETKRHFYARTALKLATIYAGEGQVSQADSLFGSIEHYLLKNRDTAALIDELAKSYSSLARYDLAELTFNKALEIRQSLPPDERDDLMASYANLGASYSVQKDYKMAELMYNRELECAEEHFGYDSPNTITPLMHLAGCFIIAGRYAEAEPCYKRILETRYKSKEENQEELLVSLLHLAELYKIQKNYSEAEIFYESACELAEQVYGPSSLKVAEILEKQANLAKQDAQSDRAAELQSRASNIRTNMPVAI